MKEEQEIAIVDAAKSAGVRKFYKMVIGENNLLQRVEWQKAK